MKKIVAENLRFSATYNFLARQVRPASLAAECRVRAYQCVARGRGLLGGRSMLDQTHYYKLESLPTL
jgi:hypothetical protein